MANILVTGGCGFIGRELVNRLSAEGHDVRILDNMSYVSSDELPAGLHVVNGSVDDSSVLRDAMAGRDVCFHLAGSPVLSDPRNTQGNGISPFIDSAGIFFTEASRQGLRVIYASSAAVYGESQDEFISETHAARPSGAHGFEKLALETAAEEHTQNHGLTSIGLRMFNIYGAGQSPHSPYCGVVRLFAEKILNGGEAVIRGDGGQTRDFVYIDDAVGALILAMDSKHEGAQVFNVCTGAPRTIIEVIDALEAAFGCPLKKTFVEDKSAGVSRSVGDPARFRDEMGFATSTSFPAGVKLMADLLANAPD